MTAINRSNYYILAFLSMVFITGVAGAKVLVPLFSDHLEASPTEIGIIVALYSFLPFLFVVHIGKWIDRIGSKFPLLISTFVGSVSLFLLLFLKNLAGIYIVQIISGLAQTVFAVAAQNYMGNTEDENQRENNIALFSLGVAVGSFLGPLIAGYFSDTFGYIDSFMIFGIIGIGSAILTLFLTKNFKRKSKQINEDKKHAYELFKISNLRKAFFISALILLGKDIYVTYFPLLALDFGLSNKTIGLIISVNAAAGIIIRWLMPYLIKKFNRNTIIFSSIFLSGTFLFILPVFNVISILLIISFVIGLGLGLGQPMSITTTIMSLPKDRVGEGLGLRISVNRLTQVVGPIFFGSLAEVIGFAGIFYIAGISIVLGSLNTKITAEQNQEKVRNA